MKKSKTADIKSNVPLFGDEPTTKAPSKAKAVKSTPKASRASVRKTLEEPKPIAAGNLSDTKKKKTKPVKNENRIDSDSSVSSTDKSSTAKDKQKSSNKNRIAKQSAEDTVQKPATSRAGRDNSAKDSKNTSGVKQDSRKPVKADTSESKRSTDKRTDASTKSSTVRSKDRVRKSETDYPSADDGTDGSEKKVKGTKKLKTKYVVTDTLPAPCQITGKPVPVNDYPTLVEVVINGEKRNVSEWSIVKGVYHPGLDSEFLVHCLRFKRETVQTQ